MANNAFTNMYYNDGEIRDFPDTSTVSVETQYTELQSISLQKKKFYKNFSKLNAREKKIITTRHLKNNAITLEELGKQLGISRERVRQIESEAINKLIHLCNV